MRFFARLRHPVLLLLLAGALPAIAGCGGENGGAASDLPPPEQSVVLIVVDTMGARYLGAWTPGLRNSPSIDRLAAEGVTFRRAYSPAPWTQPAVASLFTSLMPSEHGVRQIFHTLDLKHETLAERLRARGLRTAGVISHFVIGEKFGYGQGFETYEAVEAAGDHRAITSAKVTDLAIASLDRLAGAPFFLFVHYFDPHWYYNHHPQFDQTAGYAGELLPGMDIADLLARRAELAPADVAYLEGLYREEIAFTDAQIGRLLARLDELGLRDRTVVVLAADHGEEFMQHGSIGHTATLYDELLHVPLIVSAPGRFAPRQVEAPVSLLDVMPTLVELQGLPAPAPGEAAGRSLLPTLRDGAAPAPRPLLAEVSYIPPSADPGHVPGEPPYYKTALREGDRKLIHDHAAGSWQLYDLAADPLEQHDLTAGGASLPADLRDRLRAWEAEHTAGWAAEMGKGLTVDAETEKRLRALGYVR